MSRPGLIVNIAHEQGQTAQPDHDQLRHDHIALAVGADGRRALIVDIPLSGNRARKRDHTHGNPITYMVCTHTACL